MTERPNVLRETYVAELLVVDANESSGLACRTLGTTFAHCDRQVVS